MDIAPRLITFPVVVLLFGMFVSFGVVDQPIALAGDSKYVWDVEIIPGVSRAIFPSLGLDSSGYPGIAFYNGSLGYAFYNGSSWSIETVDSADVGAGSSIVFDAFDRPHISYYTGVMVSPDELKYAYWNGTDWVVEFLEYVGPGPVGTWAGTTSLALDSFGRPHIAYLRSDTNEVRYTRWTGSMWEKETVDIVPYGWHVSLALDSTETPHIAYHNNTSWTEGSLMYSVKNGTTWDIVMVDDQDAAGFSPSLRLDSLDRAHIAYIDPKSNLKYAHWNGNSWDKQIVHPYSDGSVSFRPWLALDPAENPCIAFKVTPPPRICYACWNGTMWNEEIVEVAEEGSFDYPTLALRFGRFPVISYEYLKATAFIKLAVGTPIEDVTPEPPSNLNAYLDGNGFENVTLTWVRSPDDGAGKDNVERYDIFRGSIYDSNGSSYSVHSSLPAGSSSLVDVGAGEGDPNDYFYRVCAVSNADISRCSGNQAGKFSRPLSNGPNLVSIPVVQSDESIETVLQTVRFDKAWFYDSSSREWKWYMKFKGYRRGLWNVNHTMGLWINVTGPSNLTVAGVVPAQTWIQLFEGWNLVSFPSFNTGYTVADLKTETGATRVEGMETMPPFPPSRLRELGDADVLQAGYGYWVKVETDSLWTVEVS